MNNKEKLIKVIDTEFNKKDNLDIIYKKINRNYRFKTNIKYAYSFCLIIVFVCIFLINNKDKKLEENNTNINTSQNTFNSEIYKENDEFDLLPNTNEEICKTLKYKEIDKIEGYNFYKYLNIGDEYNAFIMYEVYTKENIDSEEFDKLNNYIISYKVKKKEEEFKEIEISFSRDNIPITNYEFKNFETNTIKISDIDVIIYISENIEVLVFEYKNINFSIRTFNVEKSELMNLLKSIIN